MSNIIAVTGATGAQGGSVARALLKSGKWKVRAISRKTDIDAAKALTQAGAEVVAANYDDESSLQKAFEGVYGIFLVTNFWEHMFTGKTPQQAYDMEFKQATTVAKIASKLPSLKHFIWSSLPGNAPGLKPRTAVPHFDAKSNVDHYIKSNLPELAKKTSFLWVGYYANNLATYPFNKPIPLPGMGGLHIWYMPCNRKTIIPSAGDVTVNTGVFVEAILAQPEKTLGKYVAEVTDTHSHEEFLTLWCQASGKQAAFVEVDKEDFAQALGPAGREFMLNLKCFEENDAFVGIDYPDVVMAKDLGVEGKLVDSLACLQSLKDQL